MSGVLFVTRNFPPLVGGMERLALEAAHALAAAARVDLVGPRGCTAQAPGMAVEVAHGGAGRFLLDSWRAARHLAARHDYDQVIGGSGLAAPAVMAAARRCGARTACLVHGLDLVVPSRVYRAWCLPALRRCDRVIVNSRNTARLAVEAGIDAARVQILHPGVTAVTAADAGAFLSAFPRAAGRPLLIAVGRLLPRKGVTEFVRRVFPEVVAQHPDVLLVVAGGDAADALTGVGRERQRLAAAVTQAGVTEQVLVTGGLSDELLQSLYAAATLAVFPVRDLPGDVEGFGMVALEAAAHGLPTVAFAAGGVPDAVADGVSGHLVAADDHQAMAERILGYLAGDRGGVTPAGCRAFAAGFAWPLYGERLRALVLGEPAARDTGA